MHFNPETIKLEYSSCYITLFCEIKRYKFRTFLNSSFTFLGRKPFPKIPAEEACCSDATQLNFIVYSHRAHHLNLYHLLLAEFET